MQHAATTKPYEKPTANGVPACSILIVDDDPIQRAMLERFCNNRGFASVTASNGKEALELMSRSFFPIVIMDWMKPELDGVNLCRTLRDATLPGYVHIIILTIRDSQRDFLEGMSSGADHFLIKPVDPVELETRIHVAKRLIGFEWSLKKNNDELARLTVLDPLTDLFNRRYFNENLPSELKRVQRYQHPLSVVLCDIDRFRQLNEQYGRAVGDTILKTVSGALAKTLRRHVDWAVRYGGDELLVVLPEADLPEACKAAERYRAAIARRRVETPSGERSVSASFGVATFKPMAGEDLMIMDPLIMTAVRCLAQAKKLGHNGIAGAHVFDAARPAEEEICLAR